MKFSSEEYLRLLQQLDTKHAVFYRLWLVGVPRFSDEVDTAAVVFDEEGRNIDFLINPDFWESQNSTQRLFVICHECLHIILEHGTRFFWNPKIDVEKANRATDVVINHFCVNRLGFDRTEIDPDNRYCWTDTVFPDDPPSDKMSSEWYYNRIPDKATDEGANSPQTVDSHATSGEALDGFRGILKNINDELTEEEKQLIKDVLDQQGNGKSDKAGTTAGSVWSFVDTKPVKKKKKWETVIKKWAMQYMKTSTMDETQWARMNRRFTMLPDDMFIPTEMEVEERNTEMHRIQVWFFQDTSGSCSGYQQRFFDAAKSLPKDRFDVRMFCFDTKVYETSLESGKLYGYGGTRFDIIEEVIQGTIKKEKAGYPKAVFVITDGWGNSVNPEKPKNWYWFLTPRHSDHLVPSGSHTFNLKDFE